MTETLPPAISQHDEGFFRQLVEMSHEGIWVIDAAHRTVFINRTMAEQLGYSVAEMYGTSIFEFMDEVWRHVAQGNVQRLYQGNAERLDFKFRRKNGRPLWTILSTRPLFDEAGQYTGAVAMLTDITERKRAEEAEKKSRRALKVLSQSNQTLIRAKEEAQFLHDICQIIVDVGGYRLAWIGFAMQDVDKSVRPRAAAGFEAGYLETLGISWADNARGRGPTGTAIRTGKASIAHNILDDPHFAPWRTEALARGYASSIALPLAVNNEVLGALNIYAPEPDAFDTDEVLLLTELAKDIAYGVQVLRTRSQSKQAQAALLVSQKRYRSIFESAPVSIWEADFSKIANTLEELKARNITDFRSYFARHPDFVAQARRLIRIIDANLATLKLYGADSKDQLFSALREIFSEESLPSFQDMLLAIAEGRSYFESETSNRTLQGERIQVLISLSIPAETASFDSILICVVNISERKLAEEALKKLSLQRLQSYNVMAHELRNTLTKLGFVFTCINCVMSFLREQWENELQKALPDLESKQGVLEKLNRTLDQGRSLLADDTNLLALSNDLRGQQEELGNLFLLPHQERNWLDNKIRPNWQRLLQASDAWKAERGQIEELLDRLAETIWQVVDEKRIAAMVHLPEDLRRKWLHVAYTEYTTTNLDILDEVLQFMEHPALPLGHKLQLQKLLTPLVALVQVISRLQNQANRMLLSLRSGEQLEAP